MLLGFDIGGTKCGVVLGDENGIVAAEKIPTGGTPEEMLEKLMAIADRLLAGEKPEAVGISCGGPLDSRKGVILSPPNLPGWDEVPVGKIFSEHYHAPAALRNDANACALAEWRYGAGRGTRNCIFLTFGTGLGAGLILDGRLYAGTNDMAGEAGHVSLAEFGPVGYGKIGSFEGFCSGGGLAQLAETMGLEAIQQGIRPAYMSGEPVTARSVAEAAFAGDETARRVYALSGEMLGRGLAVLVDLFNPEVICIGSVFARSGALFRESMEAALRKYALPRSVSVVKILPAELGDSLGDYAALAAAADALPEEKR